MVGFQLGIYCMEGEYRDAEQKDSSIVQWNWLMICCLLQFCRERRRCYSNNHRIMGLSTDFPNNQNNLIYILQLIRYRSYSSSGLRKFKFDVRMDLP